MEKIGMGAKQTDGGLCRAVLDKCQRYTYSGEGVYDKYNDVVVNYLQRAMVNIRSAQRNIISDYASNCMVDVAQCYNNQVSQVNTWASSTSIDSVYNVMRGACRNVALTCGFAIFSGPPQIDENTGVATSWCPNANVCTDTNDEACKNNAYVTCVSEMFYESLLCPDNSKYVALCDKNEGQECANARCECVDGYEANGTSCRKECGVNEVRNTSGTCVCNAAIAELNEGVCACKSGYKPDSNGKCVVVEDIGQ
jgi:hypothetical protein